MSKNTPRVFETTLSTYTEMELLGEGGAGRVYAVKDEAGNFYALKHLDPAKSTTERRRRFRNELAFGKGNAHHNVITIIDDGFTEDGKGKSPFFVMKRYASSFRPLLDKGADATDIPRFLSDILNGIEAAHIQGVVHRDIKPENILYDDSTKSLLIADFGIAHFEEDDLYTAVETKAQARMANFQYAAPEQKVRGATVDHRADIFAIGLILCEMFTKEIPQGTNYRTIKSVAPDFAYLDDIVSVMINQDPSRRPLNIQAVKDLLNSRKEQFVLDQRLSKVKNTVIPVSEIDDPIVADPPKVVGVDWNRGQLILTLSREVNDQWIEGLRNAAGSVGYLTTAPPSYFSFRSTTVTVPADEHDANGIITRFKQWLPLATTIYKQKLENDNRQRVAAKAQRLKQEQEEIEQRQRILKKLQF